MLVAYGKGHKDIKPIVDNVLKTLNVPATALFSTLGRTAARGLETKLMAGWSMEFYNSLLSNLKNGNTDTFTKDKWDPVTLPSSAKGVGLTEAPRGALAHWIVIKDGKAAIGRPPEQVLDIL